MHLFVFFFNLLLSSVYLAIVGDFYFKYKSSRSVILFFLIPLFVLWLLISGGQYDVGVDYFNYLNSFMPDSIDKEYYYVKGDYLFYYIIKFFNAIGIQGQVLFFVFYGICFLFLFLIFKLLDFKYLFVYVILYITVTNLFNNQLNILRQSISIYIGTYGVLLYLYKNRLILSVITIFIASFFHSSILVIFVVYIFRFFYTEKKMFYFLLLGGSLLFGFLFKIEWLSNIVNILPIKSNYIYYIQSGLKIDYQPLIVKLTKYIFVPFYFLSIFYLIPKKRLTKAEYYVYYIGFICFCLRLTTLNITLVARVTNVFILLSIFPLYFYFRELYKGKQYLVFLYSILFLFIIYFLKTVIFARQEYLYQSIYF